MKRLKKLSTIWHIIITCGILLTISCGKSDNWLDVKRSKSDVLPTSLADLQAIMDNDIYMNNAYPVLGYVGTDNLYIPDDRLGAVSLAGRNAYTWAKDIYEAGTAPEFSNPYQKIAYANIVLERLNQITVSEANKAEWGHVKGQALFIRSFCNYYLAQLFCKAYDATTAETDPGLPLRMISDPGVVLPRSTIKQTYHLMIEDAKIAMDLLPEIPRYGTRASKAAAYGLLAKIYLDMQVYDESLKFAGLCLEIKSSLLDYKSNLVLPGSTYRFPAYTNAGGNPEIIFFAEGYSVAEVNAGAGVAFADPQLYLSYVEDDLRKSLFFRQHANGFMEPVGRYSGTNRPFAGMATNEIYFIRMECNARLGNVAAAMTDLNALLRMRYKKDAFTDLIEGDAENALRLILRERRKDLAFHVLSRWEDLRRLNKDSRFAITLTRSFNGVIHTLPPNDKRYVFPFPQDEIRLSGIAQNER